MRSLEGRNKPVIDDDPIGRNFRCVVAHRARDGLRGSLLVPGSSASLSGLAPRNSGTDGVARRQAVSVERRPGPSARNSRPPRLTEYAIRWLGGLAAQLQRWPGARASSFTSSRAFFSRQAVSGTGTPSIAAAKPPRRVTLTNTGCLGASSGCEDAGDGGAPSGVFAGCPGTTALERVDRLLEEDAVSLVSDGRWAAHAQMSHSARATRAA